MKKRKNIKFSFIVNKDIIFIVGIFLFILFLQFLFNKYIYSAKVYNLNLENNLNNNYIFYRNGEKIGEVNNLTYFKNYIKEKYKDKLTYGNKILSFPENVYIIKKNTFSDLNQKNEDFDALIDKISFVIDCVEIKECDTGNIYIVPNFDVWNSSIDLIKKNICNFDNSLDFKSDITVELKKHEIKNVLSKKELINKIMNPNNEQYIIEKNKTIEQVSKELGFNVNEILILNSDIDKTTIPLNSKVLNIPTKTYKNKFTMIKSIIIKEPILFQYQYITDENRYNDETKVIQKGQNGEQSVQLDIKYTASGEEMVLNRTLVSIDKNPITEIVSKGSKSKPQVGTGKFVWPTHCHRTSAEYGGDYLFGKYRMHYGLDILDNFNSDIMAIDNGVVITSTYNGGYGNYVIIDHNNGFYSLYAHLNKIKAHEGQIVKAGDVIGYMGATGIVTGTHLHLEIRVGQNTKYKAENPRKYIGY